MISGHIIIIIFIYNFKLIFIKKIKKSPILFWKNRKWTFINVQNGLLQNSFE